MRRSLVVSLALLAIVRAPAVAQTCMGLASFSAGQMQVTGNAGFADGGNSFGGTLGYGQPAGMFGNVGIGTTSIDAFDGSSLNLGVTAGYQMKLGNARQPIHVCPVASFGLGSGPKDILGSGVDMSTQAASVGLAVGTAMGASPRMQVVPAAGLSLAYGKTKFKDDAGNSADDSQTFGIADLGLGIIFNSQISVRPGVSIPLGLDGGETTFGVTVGYNFGSKHASARRR